MTYNKSWYMMWVEEVGGSEVLTDRLALYRKLSKEFEVGQTWVSETGVVETVEKVDSDGRVHLNRTSSPFITDKLGSRNSMSLDLAQQYCTQLFRLSAK